MERALSSDSKASPAQRPRQDQGSRHFWATQLRISPFSQNVPCDDFHSKTPSWVALNSFFKQQHVLRELRKTIHLCQWAGSVKQKGVLHRLSTRLGSVGSGPLEMVTFWRFHRTQVPPAPNCVHFQKPQSPTLYMSLLCSKTLIAS